MNSFVGTQGIARDIFERKQTEEALRESKERYMALFERSLDCVYLHDFEGNFLDANPATLKLFGYTKEEIASLNFASLLDEGQIPLALKTLEELKATGFQEDLTEFKLIAKNGETLYIETKASVIYRDGMPYAIQGIARNITDRKIAEEALRESEDKYRTILEDMEEGYYEVDLTGNFTFFNDSMLRIRGYSRDDLTGMNYEEYMDEATASRVYQVYNKVYTTERPVKGFEWKIKRKDGTKGYVEASISLNKNSEGIPIGFRGVVRDATERKLAEEERIRLEDQLHKSQKMEAIATLAGGIAHEFNNALMGVMGNIELLKMELPDDERRTKYFEAMNESGHRMSRLTDQLLAYSEGGKYNAKNLKLDDFTIETLPILQHDLSPEVRVETHFSKVSYIRADHAQMQMVLSAIVANSNEAIENEGIIKISAENKDIDEAFTKQHPGLKPGSYVCLTIEDDGKGMDVETRNGIFEPFFTTKFQGRGMGMAAVYGIVKNHDGWIYVDSEPGKGTVVRIYLPAIEAKEEVKKEVEKVEIVMGEGTVLVIEDEELLVGLFREILERLGYRVLLAETGKEAVELAKTFDGQIDLALLDIKLPDMDGGRVYPLIMEARPDMKVIVCSGYSIHGPAQDILDAGAEGFIQKPFSIAPFAEKLKEVLEGK
ncbi:MAG: PAS domain S-box protein [Deltaproteobacteria bacterium]|nr:PAS domain S-box protein [Deltaproteobacteria bacterium]